MTIYRTIAPSWLIEQGAKPVFEGKFSEDRIQELNSLGYNAYYFPNYPSEYKEGTHVDGSMVDTFRFIFLDMDLKDGVYSSKEEFLNVLNDSPLKPTYVIDSGRGIHAYYQVSDLDAKSFLRLQRRLCRLFKTDETVSKICQLMRVPNTVNTKDYGNFKLCEVVSTSESVYTCEDLDKLLPKITQEDEDFCVEHYNKTYEIENSTAKVDDTLPQKFAKLISENQEVKDIWSGNLDDRSKGDYRLAHILFASGFSRSEALSVLVNAAKALQRAPKHRIGYATNIVDKIWVYEGLEKEFSYELSSSVEDILQRPLKNAHEGLRFACSPIVDATDHGFRLSEVMGLVGGSGAGKTTFALNLFRWFVERNPDYIHFFVSLEQPEKEIAERWATMCGSDTRLHSKVHIVGNYNVDGTYRNLSLSQIQDYILKFQKSTGKKAGCVVIDHIGALKKQSKNGEAQALIDICHGLKSFAVETNTFLVIQSQTSREKAGIGDLELDKDAAFGTTTFEWYVDYLTTIWQPLKRVYAKAPSMTVTAFKFCKIRKKNVKKDNIKEDERYTLILDVDSEQFRELTQDEEKSFVFWNSQATTLRKQDRKSDVLTYKSVDWTKEAVSAGKPSSIKDTTGSNRLN